MHCRKLHFRYLCSVASDSRPDNAPPRVRLALPMGDLRARLLAALGDTGVEVQAMDPHAGLDEALVGDGVDVIVLRRAQVESLGDHGLAGAGPNQPSPGIIVISEGEGPVGRSDLLSAGAANVLDAKDDAGLLAESIEAIAEAEQAGGGGGPEGRDADAEPRLADFLSRSAYMRDFIDTVRQVAATDSTLLITGETGVGKERLARAVHAESERSEQPFVAVNCGALSPELLQSELFGHVRGAFTGADVDRVGVFMAANRGTLFLDEIGEMAPELQVKLLTVLQRREVVPVGATDPLPVDVRVVAATHRDVRSQVAEGTFREDLFYRIAVIPLEIPPLRDRAEDIPDLVGRLIRFFRTNLPTSHVTSISKEALDAMSSYPWPGNVRELINAVERGMLLSMGEEISLDALPPEVVGSAAEVGLRLESAPGTAEQPDLARTLKETREAAVGVAESAYLRGLLKEEGGVINRTAERAGISPRALYDRLKRYGIDKDDFRESVS
ncbi:MAG: two-component system response regulator AtoC [Planctomycetota bacterium]|jgi:two-component system response regulator AtoC